MSYIIQVLILLLAANGAPIMLNWLIGKRWAYPIDNGLKLTDGYRLFGDSKTWRGILSALCATTGLAVAFNIGLLTGLWFGILAMAGDLLASFSKRRLGYGESSQVRGFDTVPESLLPLLILKATLTLSAIDILLIVGIFFLFEEFVSPILYRWHIRKKPY
ncbi:MAG: CDP-archaeol synthase [Methylovulum sp.]|nr:CDP-archaeol synthase [Methylovulum sp.]